MIRVEDRGRRERLATLIPDMPWIGTSPVFLVFCGDARRLERMANFVDTQTTMAASKASLMPLLALLWFCKLLSSPPKLPVSAAARSARCATTPVRSPIYWNCPTRCFRTPGCASGAPAAEGFISMRLPLAVTLHNDHYDDHDLSQSVAVYDRRRAARYAPPREQQRAAEIFGYADF